MGQRATGQYETGRKAVTANRLTDGAVVWLAAHGHWVERVGDALVLGELALPAALATAQAGERANQIIGAYAVDVETGPAGPWPLRLRERLRAGGPSVHAEQNRDFEARRDAA